MDDSVIMSLLFCVAQSNFRANERKEIQLPFFCAKIKFEFEGPFGPKGDSSGRTDKLTDRRTTGLRELDKHLVFFYIERSICTSNIYSPALYTLCVHLYLFTDVYVSLFIQSGYSHIVYMRIIFYPHIVCSSLVILEFKFKILFLKSKILI